MNTYRITLRGCEGSRDIVAATPGSAKYQHYLELDGLFDSFRKYLDAVENIHKVDAHDQRAVDAVLRFNKVKEARGLHHVYLGQTVRVGDRYGTLVGGNSSMNFDVMINGIRYNVHPGDIVYPERVRADARGW